MATQPLEAVDQPAAPVEGADALADNYDPASFYNETPQNQPANDAQPGEGDAPPVDGEDGDPQEGDEQTEAIDAPASWAKDAKEVFATLPREAQEIIATREREREAFVSAKGNEVVQARKAAEREALQVLQQDRQTQAQRYEQAMQALGMQVREPDARLLQSGDPADQALFYQQDRQYRLQAAQFQALEQQAEEARREAAQVEQQMTADQLQADHDTLVGKLGTEWSDPSARAKLISDLEPIAAELGFSAEAQAQAGAGDILALVKVREWRDKAARLDALNKKRMEPVRAAKGQQQIPPSGRIPAAGAQRQAQSIESVLYPNDVRR